MGPNNLDFRPIGLSGYTLEL